MGYARVTLATLRTQLADRLSTNGVFWSQAEQDRALNEAVAMWQAMTGDHIITVTQVVTNTTENLVTLNTTDTNGQVLSVIRVVPAAGGASLRDLNMYDLDQGFYGWRTQTATATTQRPEYWAPVGIGKIYLYPRTGATVTYSMTCYGDIAVLTNTTDYIDINEGELQRLLGMAQAILAFKEGVVEGTENANALKELFLYIAKTRNKELQKFAAYKNYMSDKANDVESENIVEPTPRATGGKG